MKKESNEKIKISSIIFTIIKVICIILLILLILVLAMQRFSNNKIAVGGFRVFNVATESMVPKYKVGDVIVIQETDINKLVVGDDITYLGKKGTFAGRVVTHQIIKIEETEEGKIFHTKGIANNAEDPTITGDQIYGKVIYKCIILSLLTQLMNNMTAFYVVIFIPLAFLIVLQLKDIKDSKNEEDDEDDEDDEQDDDEVEENNDEENEEE